MIRKSAKRFPSGIAKNKGRFRNSILFAPAPSRERGFFQVESAGHYDMYYKPEYVNQATDRLPAFYSKHLIT